MTQDVGTILGKYRILSSIATGGMGEVFYAKADGVEGFSRPVAIKRLLPHLCGNRSFVDMMVAEAKLTVLLDHPNIVRVFDLAKERQRYFIAMEFVPGVTVAQLLEYAIAKDIVLPVRICVFIALEALRGLAYAHLLETPQGESNGILHRDVSPQNVLVTGRGDVKLADFGIARAKTHIRQAAEAPITGKVGYLAPEQLAGGDGDERADLYGVGIVLWEMLARRRLFRGLDDADSYRLMSEAYVPDVRQVREDIPEGLYYCLLRCMQKEPSERYDNARAFIDGLQEATDTYDTDELRQEAASFLSAQPELFAQIQAQIAAAESLVPKAQQATRAPTRLLLSLAALLPSGSSFFGQKRVGAVVSTTVLGVLGCLCASLYVRRGPDLRASTPSEKVSLQPVSLVSSSLAPSTELKIVPAQGAKAFAQTPHSELSVEEVREVALVKREALFGCFSRLEKGALPPQVTASLVVASDGHVASADTQPPVSADADACLARVFGELTFRERKGDDVRVEIPLSLRRL